MKMDARTRYTLNAVRETFIRLLKENPVNKVTVKKLCEEAGINRATFYRYYEDVYDLYEKFKEELIAEFFSDFRFRGIHDIEEDMACFLQSIRANADAVHALSNQSDALNFMQSVCERIYYSFERDFKVICSDLDESQLQATYYFLICGSTGIIAAWIARGMESDEKIIAENLTRLIKNTLADL